MNKIFKYTLEIVGEQSLELPSGYTILTVQNQMENLCLWALVNPDNPTVTTTIRIIGTGHDISSTKNLHYIGSIQQLMGSLVWHVFEELK